MSPSAGLLATDVSPGTASPGELVERAARSDETAWRALVDRFKAMVWSITRAHGLSGSDAADVSQTVWLRLVDNLERLREPERVGTWLAVTTRHECIRVSQLRQRSVLTAEPEAVEALGSPVDDDPEFAFARQDRDGALRAVVATLPERSQALLRMLMADPPVSYGEVAAGLGIPIGSIGPTRQRRFKVLRAKCVSAGISL